MNRINGLAKESTFIQTSDATRGRTRMTVHTDMEYSSLLKATSYTTETGSEANSLVSELCFINPFFAYIFSFWMGYIDPLRGAIVL